MGGGNGQKSATARARKEKEEAKRRGAVVAGALPPLAALAAKPASTGVHLSLKGATSHEQSKKGG
ncbi:MAG: hypothetical protein FRX49_11685 [Trebouxia sp. A1-2]|nr:MAG: hypothetical protein FRX49_11685 [Trebouxia sp. A1-2]